jgi:hypothetical protein
MKTFRGRLDYKAAFSEAVSALLYGTARGLDREERILLAAELAEEYIQATGERPPITDAERLANLILLDELLDSHPDKVTREEYPFFSDRQLERRRSVETSLSEAETIATDGRNYRKPTRRKRTIRELVFVDEHARGKNEDRRRQYNAFKNGRKTYRIDGERKPVRFLVFNGKEYKNVKI